MNKSIDELEKKTRQFLYSSENASYLIHRIKSLSFGNIAIWLSILEKKKPKCIVEFGTQTGCSSTILAQLNRFLGLETKIVSINIRDELEYPDPAVTYVIDDFTNKMEEVWSLWEPDIIFQDAHMHDLIRNQIHTGFRHPETMHVFHDVGFRMFNNPMEISKNSVPTGKSGSWERHVLAEIISKSLLEKNKRTFENNDVRIHIFDEVANPREYGLGILEIKS